MYYAVMYRGKWHTCRFIQEYTVDGVIRNIVRLLDGTILDILASDVDA